MSDPLATSESVIRASLETSAHRDLDALRAQLDAWLARRASGARIAEIDVPAASGASSEIFFLTFGSGTRFGEVPVTEAVLRLAPRYAVYPIVDLGQQFQCMDRAARYGPAPVPQALAYEADASILGAPFLLMERRHGRGAPDWPSYVREGWIHDLAREQQETLWRNGVRAVAAVHATDLAGLAPGALALPVPGTTALDRALAYWRRYLELVSRGGDYPMLHTAVEWLERHRPELALRSKLVWGDASLRNMLFDDLEPAALLDFEFAHVGLYPFDIAFYALMDYVMAQGFAAGAPRLPGFLGVQDTLDYYEELTGAPVPQREYFLRMAVTYMSLATTRVFQRLAAEGRIEAALVARNPPLGILTEIFTTGVLPR